MNMWQSEANKKQEVPDDPPCDDRNIKILWDEYQQDMKGERCFFLFCFFFVEYSLTKYSLMWEQKSTTQKKWMTL